MRKLYHLAPPFIYTDGGMNDMLLVYITCKSNREAETIGRVLLRKRLVACINIIDGMHSAYFWPPGKDRIEEARETILLCKTIASKWKSVEREVLILHSYDTPDIMALPVPYVSKKYADWLLGELT